MSGGLLGKVTQVRERKVGTELARDHVAGEDSLELEDVGELPAPGGSLIIGAVTHTYTRDDSEDQDADELEIEETPELDAGTVTIAPPLTVDHDDGDRVLVSPPAFVREAYVFLEEQQEEIPARVDDSLYANVDRLPTGTREDPEAAETVVVVAEDDEHIVRDVVGEQGQGLGRGYAAAAGPFDASGAILADPITLAAIAVDIPTSDHRLLVWYSFRFTADDGVAANVHLDDFGFDFEPGAFPLATLYGSATIPGPNRVMSAAPSLNLATVTATIGDEVTGAWEAPPLPIPILPYAAEEPSPGLHIFRLAASRFSGTGAISVDDVKFWATVI